MPVELSRTVRFCLRPDGSLDAASAVSNSYAAWPAMRGLGRYYELTVSCRGEPDTRTGYFMNIKRIDEAARRVALPIIAAAAGSADDADRLGRLMRALVEVMDSELGGVVSSVRLALTPTVSIAMEKSDMAHALIAQQYEFAAAHRLHAPALSEAENRAVFGKCNNPAGHGHNYRVEVAVRCPVDAAGRVLDIAQLDALVDRAVIAKLDHKNLDVDVPEFQGRTSSVENIARVIYDLLAGEVGPIGVALAHVRVWETEKTACTYAG